MILLIKEARLLPELRVDLAVEKVYGVACLIACRHGVVHVAYMLQQYKAAVIHAASTNCSTLYSAELAVLYLYRVIHARCRGVVNGPTNLQRAIVIR